MYTLYQAEARHRHTALLPPAEKNGNVTPMTGRSARHMPIFETDCKAMSPKKPKHMQRPRSSLAFDAIYSTRRRYNNNNTMMAGAADEAELLAGNGEDKITVLERDEVCFDTRTVKQPFAGQLAAADGDTSCTCW